MIRALALVLAFTLGAAGATAQTALQRQNEALFQQLDEVHNLSNSEMQRIREIFARRGFMGQGNPAVTERPMTVQQCLARIPGGPEGYRNRQFERICGDKYMAPLYDPRTERPQDATACIDMFEFPNIPCAYPVVWVKTMEAAQICAAQGKRLCDAHEWEGACAGALEPPDYRFDLAAGVSASAAVNRMRNWHNNKYAPTKRWSYGPTFQRGVCAQDSFKTPSCPGGGFNRCGSNHYPVGSFPNCRSPLGVYDLNGNAAEHMNLPLAPDQMASRGSQKLGVTEMKGSWFIWDKVNAHPDWCRWRAPFWHGSAVMSPRSHENYHLGFRCCKTVD